MPAAHLKPHRHIVLPPVRRRFQDQQAFTDQILRALTGQLTPEGAAVLVEAKHMAEGPDAPMHLTSAAHGVFAEPNSTRATVRLESALFRAQRDYSCRSRASESSLVLVAL